MTEAKETIKEAKEEILPFESWEQLTGEGSAAFLAFRIYRDYGADRTIKKAIDSVDDKNFPQKRSYGTWRKWAVQFRWKERTADYDKYNEGLKQTEHRKTIEAQAEMHRIVTGKMLDVVNKKLDTMNPADLPIGSVTDWVTTAIKSEREAAGLVLQNDKTEPKQGEFNFVSDFQGL